MEEEDCRRWGGVGGGQVTLGEGVIVCGGGDHTHTHKVAHSVK